MDRAGPVRTNSRQTRRPARLPIDVPMRLRFPRFPQILRPSTSAASPCTWRLWARLRHIIKRWRIELCSHDLLNWVEAWSSSKIHQRAIRNGRLIQSTAVICVRCLADVAIRTVPSAQVPKWHDTIFRLCRCCGEGWCPLCPGLFRQQPPEPECPTLCRGDGPWHVRGNPLTRVAPLQYPTFLRS